jgi:Sec-independent protein translocase protein TatA
MEILGIGPLELVLILIVALIVLGPKDMVKAGRTLGRTLRTIVSSETWRVVQQASREMRNLPNRLIREAGIEDLQKQMPTSAQLSQQAGLDELKKGLTLDLGSNPDISPWTTPPENILPPQVGAPDAVQASLPEPAESADLLPPPGAESDKPSPENPPA